MVPHEENGSNELSGTLYYMQEEGKTREAECEREGIGHY
jgi:hypothetical protein